MTYKEALQYLESFVNYEKVDSYNYKSSLKLERMKRFAALLGDPQKYTRSIHIAGTKGKGSTAAFTYSILKSAGFKTGLYTSPHLISFRERIRVDDELISESDLARLLNKIKDVVEYPMKDDRPSFFEVYTAIAYLYFKEKNVDFAVYEVGLGGRLDATNLIEPLVSAITPLSYEHTDKLGNSLEEIAAEKCGIIKNNSICVSAPQEENPLKVIRDICKERNTRLILVGKDILYKETHSDDEKEVFDITGTSDKYTALESRLIGSHQMINAATAIGIIEALKFHNIKVAPDSIREGIGDAQWEGRLEIAAKRPYIIFDGAQNAASAGCLADAIKKIFKYKKLILVFGVSNDKDVKGMLEKLLPLIDSAILTKSKIVSRALEPEKIKETALGMGIGMKELILTSDVGCAIEKALLKADKDDMILITGSLFVVGEAKGLINTIYSPILLKSFSDISGRGC